jgi:hypothetical protein
MKPLSIAMLVVFVAQGADPAAWASTSANIGSVRSALAFHTRRESSGTTPEFRMISAEYRALETLLSIARRRQHHFGPGDGRDLSARDQRLVETDVDRLEHAESERDDRQGILFIFARSCSECSSILGGDGSRNEAASAAFDYAFWDASKRISSFRGPEAHACLLELRKSLDDIWSKDEMDALIATQAGASPKQAQRIRQRHI